MTDAAAHEQLAERLAHTYTGVVYDVMRDAGREVRTLPSDIRPLLPDVKLAGPVFTVAGEIDETLEVHQTMLEWTGLLERAPAGHVLICQPNDSTIAHMGELSAETLQLRGVRGYIVDGGCRDTDFVRDIQFPVWRRYDTPADVRGRWAPTALGEPIQIGGTAVETGDFVLADQDGVVLIPGADAEEIIAAAEEALQQENLVRAAIREGTPPQQAYLKYGKF
ncbi:RraA family protein [Ornithinicoccus halotolerans]|uniref:RraA family protein n=1 Tax=Ornithinicoccus halotolerans TaxID=1748220 RepID=UPI001E60146F|nr:RraA family protein [Ornithinicoccus halotolerans]